MTGTTATRLDPIEKRIELAVTPARAFAHFTQAIGSWWPLATHSLSEARARAVVFEAHEGGRIYERDDQGAEHEWGKVLKCEPGALLVFSWVLGRPDHATEVEVRFEAEGDAGCIMTLIHRGWDQLPDGATLRGNYDGGWDYVLGEYLKALD